MTSIPFRFVKRDEVAPRRFESPLVQWDRDIQRLFDGFFSDLDVGLPRRLTQAAFSPRVDVHEEPAAFTVTAELPGLDEKDIELSFHNGVLTLRGEKKWEEEKKDKQSIRIERSYGSFAREIPFATDIDDDNLTAEFKKGVLTVTLPKTQAAIKESKKIQIKSA